MSIRIQRKESGDRKAGTGLIICPPRIAAFGLQPEGSDSGGTDN